jgi:AraC-like DNA-binding protein
VDVLQMLCARHAAGREDRAEDGRPSATLCLVRDYLEAHFAKSISLMELSTLSGVSPFHLSRRFRARYGLPPYLYLELVRVNRAREMLRRGEPISRVAFDTGFSDQSHLTRRFKRVVGVPPGQYAKTYGSSRAGETRVACISGCAGLRVWGVEVFTGLRFTGLRIHGFERSHGPGMLMRPEAVSHPRTRPPAHPRATTRSGAVGAGPARSQTL